VTARVQVVHQDPEPVALMLPRQVAAAFRVDVKTVARWAKAGRLRSVRTPGGHRRYLTAQVEALLNRGEGDA
jgi:excisionase family DNA binding protein